MFRTAKLLLRCHRLLHPIKLKPKLERSLQERLLLLLLENWYRATLAGRYVASVPLSVRIGDDLRLLHGYSGIFIVSGAWIGSRVTLHQHVTIGMSRHGVPRIGDDVFVGAAATIIGKTVIGDGARIGAGVTLVDAVVDPGAVIVNASAYDLTNGRYVRDVASRTAPPRTSTANPAVNR